MQVLELIIFGGLAAIVLYQLYAVLGRRVGRQPSDTPAPVKTGGVRAADALPEPPHDGVPLTGLAALKAQDATFDVGQFLHGAKTAYGMVVKAFAAGDRDTLRNLLAPNVLAGFETVIDQRAAEGRSVNVEFLHAPRADLEKVEMARTPLAQITVRFLAELRTRSKGPEGEAVDDTRTAELWTFERDLKNRDPNWTLIHVDTAEA